MNKSTNICIKTGRPIVHPVVCQMCLRKCPRAGRQGRRCRSVVTKRFLIENEGLNNEWR